MTRLVDLRCDWLRQYATETNLYEGGLYPEIPGRVGRLDGYLLGCSLSILVCARKLEDWATCADRWGALGLMIARYEAEFAGRIVRDPGDVGRFRSSPADGMCWGVIGVGGCEALVREAADLDRLPDLWRRGVRVFQPIGAEGGLLGGAAEGDADRGLTDLGRALLERIAGLSVPGVPGPRPILDLAGMNLATMDGVLRWIDEIPASRIRPPIVVSHGTFDYRALLDAGSAEARTLGALRSRGGMIGLTPGRPGCQTADELKALVEAIARMPFSGEVGAGGVAIGTDVLGVERAAPGLVSAREIVRRIEQAFDRATAARLAAENSREWLLEAIGR